MAFSVATLSPPHWPLASSQPRVASRGSCGAARHLRAGATPEAFSSRRCHHGASAGSPRRRQAAPGAA
eukprot:3261814-Lingulodinium_polyedra.AAC.1